MVTFIIGFLCGAFALAAGALIFASKKPRVIAEQVYKFEENAVNKEREKQYKQAMDSLKDKNVK